ncbi:MAG: hypothetical protein MI799_04705 [Desulfobacterales bacterium]|nr:hypothetical protein [Desulfobacterales bacterium]
MKNNLCFYAVVILFTAEILFVLDTSAFAAAMQIHSITCKYDLRLKDKKIGETVMIRSRPKASAADLIQVKTVTNIAVKGFWGTWTLEQKSVVEQNPSGIVSFDHKIIEGKKKWHLFGRQFDQALWCSARNVLTKKELDEKQVVDLGAFVAARTIPYADIAFMTIDLLSDSDDEQGDVSVPLDRFDTTCSTLPDCLAKLPPKKQKTIRILDTSELKITTADIAVKRDEQITLAKKTFSSRVFDIKTKESRSTCWISQDGLGAFIVREQGKDKDGPFEYILTEIHEKN